MSASLSADHLEGSVLDGRFELGCFVARGGYGSVYRGTHRTLGCSIAVKLLDVPEHLRGEAQARSFEAFAREARTIATLRHPAIVRVYDAGLVEVDGVSRPFIAMEWLDGEPLDRVLVRERGRARSPKDALALLRPLFEAIACAHEAGVVHRDIKPGNIILARGARGEQQTRVLDFGVAKVMERDAPGADVIAATSEAFSPFSLSHASPEQIGRLRTGPWTDVHALALLLVEVLVGERALRGANTVELFASITSKERPSPAAFGVDVGPWEATLRSSLSIHPGDRPRDAGALLRALDGDLDAAQSVWSRPITLRELPAVSRTSAPPAPALPRTAWVLGLAAVTVAALSLDRPARAPTPTGAASSVASRPLAQAERASPPAPLATPVTAVATTTAPPRPFPAVTPDAPLRHPRRRAQLAPPTSRAETERARAPIATARVDGIAID